MEHKQDIKVHVCNVLKSFVSTISFFLKKIDIILRSGKRIMKRSKNFYFIKISINFVKTCMNDWFNSR